MSASGAGGLGTGRILRQASAAAHAYRLAPPARLSSGPAGVYLGTGSGTSIDFHDFREYQPGDDLRRVDWSAYARSDHLLIRLFREEIAPVVEVFLDHSASMGLYPAKADSARFACAFLEGVTRQAEGRSVLVTPQRRYSGGDYAAGLERTVFNGDLTLADARYAVRAGQKPIRFLVSDFLHPGDPKELLRRYARDAAVVIVVLLLSRSERDPEFSGGVRLVEVEAPDRQQDLHVAHAQVARYRRRLATHLNALRGAARELRCSLVEVELPDAFSDVEQLRSAIIQTLWHAGIVEAA
jgi:uncharacterized protein (DUF58 family)